MALQDLSVEVVLAILMGLDWDDILRVRKTCRALYCATKEHCIWMNLFNRTTLVAVNGHGFRLDYPIELYTSQELECYTLKAISSDRVWTNRDLTIVPERKIAGASQMAHFYLSESGRFLFVLAKTGAVDYYDLDDHELSNQLSIPGSPSNYEQAFMIVDVDYNEPNLTFNLVLYTGYTDDHRASLFQIWRVQLGIDPLVRQPFFVAKRLASFPKETDGIPCNMSLLENAFAYCVSERYSYPAYVVVVDWKAISGATASEPSEGLGYRKRIISLHHRSKHPRLRLLPDCRVFVVSQHHAQLFRYRSIEVIHTFIWEQYFRVRATEPYYQYYNKAYKPETLSPAFLCQSTETIKLVVSADKDIRVFELPLIDNAPIYNGTYPRHFGLIHPFREVVPQNCIHFGRFKGIAFPNKPMAPDEWPPLLIGPRQPLRPMQLAINYTWPNQAGIFQANSRRKPFIEYGSQECLYPIAFCEFTGRTLALSTCRQWVFILDINLVA